MFKFLLTAIAICAAPVAQAAGVQFVTVPADAQGPTLTGAVWTPCAAAAQQMKLCGRTVQGTMNCPIVGDRLPMVVVSHGKNGWFGAYHDTAEALADAGFIVVAISHPGDNAFEASRTIVANAISRPSDVMRLIDFMLKTWGDASKINPLRVGFYGHSAGGYTGIVIAGGRPDFKRAADLCAKGLRSGSPSCEQFQDVDTSVHPPAPDPRVKALVIADPGGTIFFGPDDLKDVNVPVQLWSSERGGAGVTVQSVANLNHKLPREAEYHLVPNAGHWSFLAPCPPERAQKDRRACVDASGFDRPTFHKYLLDEMIAFYNKTIPDGPR